MINLQKQFHIVAGIPVLKVKPTQDREGTFGEFSQEGIKSVPLLEKILKTAIGRYRCKYEVGPPKTEERFQIKAKTRGYDCPSQNTDYCRAFIYVTNPEQIIKLANFFRPSNNSAIELFEDTFAVPKITTDLRRIQIKIKLPNGHVAEIQIRHKKMKAAFEKSHFAYQRQAAIEKRFPDPASRSPETQKQYDRWKLKRRDANHDAACRIPSLNKLIHEREFYKVGKTPVMVVIEPFTGKHYSIVPESTEKGPMYVVDNAFLPLIGTGEKAEDQRITRDRFITISTSSAKKMINEPAFKAVA